MVTTTTTTPDSDYDDNNNNNDEYCRSHLNPAVVEKLEAGAFRELCRHLQERSDAVQNMDLMTLSGFCRNCLAKWMVLEARRLVDQQQSRGGGDDAAAGAAISSSTSAGSERLLLDTGTIQALNALGYEEAAQHVYGMTYSDYKKRHQKKATDEQVERYQASAHLHSQHDKALLDTRASAASFPTCTSTTKTTATMTTTTPAVAPSSVCCENVEQVAAAAALHGRTTVSATTGTANIGSRSVPAYQAAPIPSKLLFNSTSSSSSSSMETDQQRPPLRIGVLTVSDRAHNKEYATGDLSGPAVVSEIQKLWNQAAAQQRQQQQSSSSSSSLFSSPSSLTSSSPPPVFETSIVPDEIDAIQQQIKAWCGDCSSSRRSRSRSSDMDLIFTTGGTGFGRRDVTPEATRPLLYQECTSLMSFCATECSRLQPLASLSRGTAGIILPQQHPEHEQQHQEQEQNQMSSSISATNTTMIANLPGNPQAIAEIMPLLLPLLLHALCDLRGI